MLYQKGTHNIGLVECIGKESKVFFDLDNKQNMSEEDLLQQLGPALASICKQNNIAVSDLELQITKNKSHNKYHLIVTNA